MKEMGYNLRRGKCLNFGRGRRIPLQPFVPKGKPANYYDQTRRGLGYTTPSIQSNLDSEKPLPSHSSYSLGWEFDVSMGVAFKKLFVNMISTSQVEPEGNIGSFDTNPWAKQLDLKWEKRFEQCDPPTEDKVIQIDVGDQTQLKLISISKSLSPMEKQDLISLIKEYIDVFTWSYEDMSGLDPQVVMHHLNIKLEAKPVKQLQSN